METFLMWAFWISFGIFVAGTIVLLVRKLWLFAGVTAFVSLALVLWLVGPLPQIFGYGVFWTSTATAMDDPVTLAEPTPTPGSTPEVKVPLGIANDAAGAVGGQLQDPAVVPAETQNRSLPTLSREALGVLAEVDQATKVSNPGSAYADFRMEVANPGQVAAGALVFNVTGVITQARIVCDDACTGFYLVSVDGTVQQLYPQRHYAVSYDYQSLNADERQLAADLGINVVDSELLAQNLFIDRIVVKVGDQLVINGRDDASLAVNRGIFVSWVLE